MQEALTVSACKFKINIGVSRDEKDKRGAQKRVGESEETCSMFKMQNITIKEGIKTRVERWVITAVIRQLEVNRNKTNNNKRTDYSLSSE